MGKIELIFFIIFFGFVEKSISRYDEFTQRYEAMKIGGLFDGVSQETEMVFKFAVQIQNQLNHRDRNLVQLRMSSKQVSYGNEFFAAQTACKMIENGVIGILAPSSPESVVHVRSICDAKEIPFIECSIDGSSKGVINLHPTPEDLGKMYLDMIFEWDWHGFTILYQNAPWLPLVEYVLKNYNKRHTVTVRQIDSTANQNYRPQLRRVKQSSDKNILLCCSIEALPEILKQAQQVGLMTDEHNFLITTLDMHTIDLEPFQYSGTNITGFRLVVPDNPFVVSTTNLFKEMYLKKNPTIEENDNDNEDSDKGDERTTEIEDEIPRGLTAENLQLTTALTYDAVALFSYVMSQHKGVKSEGITCDDRESSFVNGTSIFNSMKTIPPFKGLSGEVQFDQHGNRENFEVEIVELSSEGLHKVGTWNASKGFQSSRAKIIENDNTNLNDIRNKTLLVLTVLTPPYGFLKESLTPLQGNDRFEGFAIELIEKLSQRLEFNYTFKLQEDGAYGSLNKEKNEWDGMLRELMDDKADLAITDLTITAERESAVDFTMPFMNLGISILFEKPKKSDPELFSFLQPFSSGVWGCLFACFFLVSVSLFVMGRMSPAEWDNPYPCIEEPEVLVNQFSFKNSMWFSIGALLQQGSEIAPKAPSTRIVASMWWFFTLIMVSSYTANLAAFLTVENPSPLIEDVQDLVNGKVKYGAKRGGSTLSFFKETENENYRKMYEYMIANPSLLTGSNDDGLKEAKKGKYAFLMESSTIEYMVQRNCEVVQVGGELDAKGYGIAMKKNSPYRGALSEAVLQMQESGEISRMRTKWWKEKRGGGACGGSDSDGKVADLNMKNVGGVFVVLTGGCIFATVLGVFQWIINMKRLSILHGIPFKEIFLAEFRFFRQFGTHVKTTFNRKSSSQMDSVNESNSGSRKSRSSANLNNNSESIGFRLSLKNLNKVSSRDDDDNGKI